MTSLAIIDSMALVIAGKRAIDSTVLSRIDRLLVADLVCRHSWGGAWKARVPELASSGTPVEIVSVPDLSRAIALQRLIGKRLATADFATLALAEENNWVLVAGCQHVAAAAKQLDLKHLSII